MSDVEVPPNLQEELAKLQQLQQTLQVIVAQKQQVEVELTDVDKALEEIKKMSDENPVYQAIGAFLVRRDKETVIKELTERRELLTVRASVLGKQEERTRERLREVQQQIQARLREQKLM
ncbi:MAG: prefoldin subunit beta [Candidatus Bathyarchaeota archaeon]|nr:prefoldin subunit beta [Candidatus Bathyarchaeota archaeon]